MAKINTPEPPPSANLIQSGTVITGDIETNGNMRFDGTLTGTVISGGKVILGSTGSIEGEITCVNADIEGKVTGLIHVQELLSLKATAVVTGDIYTNKLSIEPGAKFTGTCHMDGTPVDSTVEYAQQETV